MPEAPPSTSSATPFTWNAMASIPTTDEYNVVLRAVPVESYTQNQQRLHAAIQDGGFLRLALQAFSSAGSGFKIFDTQVVGKLNGDDFVLCETNILPEIKVRGWSKKAGDDTAWDYSGVTVKFKAMS